MYEDSVSGGNVDDSRDMAQKSNRWRGSWRVEVGPVGISGSYKGGICKT